MTSRNIKLLTDSERQFFNENYEFEVLDNMLVIRCKTFNRPNLKPLNENFELSSKVRKITITTKAINLWLSTFKEQNISLTDVQNAINALIICYEDLSKEEVEKQIKLMYK